MRKFHFGLSSVCAALILVAPFRLPAQDSPKPLATVAGQPIYEQDLMSLAGPSLLDLRKQEYKLKSDVLNQAIRNKLVELEAKKKGVTSEELLKQEVDSKVAEPSDDKAAGNEPVRYAEPALNRKRVTEVCAVLNELYSLPKNDWRRFEQTAAD